MTEPTSPPPPPPLPVGSWARDRYTKRVGQITAHLADLLTLHSPAGGPAWHAHPTEVEPLSPAEALSAKVTEANNAHRWHARTARPNSHDTAHGPCNAPDPEAESDHRGPDGVMIDELHPGRTRP